MVCLTIWSVPRVLCRYALTVSFGQKRQLNKRMSIMKPKTCDTTPNKKQIIR